MMEQEWRNDCQMLLHPEQAIIDESKITLEQTSIDLPQMSQPNSLVSKYSCAELVGITR